MKIYFITGNKDKLAEAVSVIPEIEAKDIDLPELQEIDTKKIIELKLTEAAKYLSDDIIVEDTSLYLEGMNGLPGSLIKWFMKTIGNEGLVKLANIFGNDAVAKVWIGYLHQDKVEFFDGSIKGKIVEPRGTNGFAWDTVFEVEGTGKTFAEMTAEEKNSISMRRIAFEKLKKFLEK